MAPNIVWVNLDQLRWDAVGYSGNSIIQTPNIDRLASRGAWFENAYCASPVCSPARASWFTGLYPHAHQVFTNYGPDRKGVFGCYLPKEIVTIGDVLKKQGYKCGNVGVWHLGWDELPQHGFTDYWIGYKYRSEEVGDPFFRYLEDLGLSNPYGKEPQGVFRYGKEMPLGVLTDPRQQRTTWTVDRAIDFLELVSREPIQAEPGRAEPGRADPFFLMVGIKDPHPPCIPPQELLALYPLDELPFPENFLDGLEGKPDYQSKIRCRVPPGSVNPIDFRTVIRYYYALITHVDREIGRLVEHLEQKGIFENTIFVLNSDHGEMLGNHGFVEKCLMYEESARVPCLISWPEKIPEKQRITAPLGGVDLVPTLLELAQAPIPELMDGRSFADAICSGVQPASKPIFAEIASDAAVYRGNIVSEQYAAHLMVLDDGWKFVWNRYDDDELYNLGDDPSEMANLAEDPTHENRIEGMKGFIVEMLQNTGPGLYEWCKK